MKSVYVGLSGGVDSSVTAALLLESGYRVVGVHMQNWTRQIAGIDCPWEQDLADAKRTAVFLGVPFKVFDFQKEYKQKVVDYMVSEYAAGRTPNPDIMCNQEVKFKLFLDSAKQDGADLIATGHYARVKDGHLYQAADSLKDQTYFLGRVSGAALRSSLMPLGEYTKQQVRALAEKLNLPTAKRPDSQGICFVGEVGIPEFLGEFVEAKPGPIELDGKIIGQHKGAIFYTLGQRHGLGMGIGRPLYVTGKNMDTNTVYVTDDPQSSELKTDSFNIDQTHWICEPPKLDDELRVQTRYWGRQINCRITPISSAEYKVEMDEFERAITPGQSAIFYRDQEVLGGGIIT